MNNAASILTLAFLAVTFLQSAHDKLFHWKDNVSWLTGHFAQTPIRNMVPFSLGIVTVLEILAGIFSVAGIIQLFLYNEKTLGLYGGIFSCICLIFLLMGQRLAKDYDGARTIAIYFIPAVLAVFWLG